MRPPAETGSLGRGGTVQAGGRRQGRLAEAGQCRQVGSAAAKIFGASIRGVRGRKNMRGFHLGSGKPPEKARLKKSKHFLVFLEMRDFLSTATSPRGGDQGDRASLPRPDTLPAIGENHGPEKRTVFFPRALFRGASRCPDVPEYFCALARHECPRIFLRLHCPSACASRLCQPALPPPVCLRVPPLPRLPVSAGGLLFRVGAGGSLPCRRCKCHASRNPSSAGKKKPLDGETKEGQF